VNCETNGRVEDLLEGLVQKIERMSREKEKDLEDSRRALASIDRLVVAMKQLEYQKRREKIVAQKVAYLQKRLERTSGQDRGSLETKSLTETVNRILSGAKATGQVIEIVAGSLQAMIETVKTVIKSQSTGARGGATPGEPKGTDLAALLKPVNALLNSLITRPQSPAASETDKDSKVVEGQKTKKGDNSSVPVVKAVPLTEESIGESQETK